MWRCCAIPRLAPTPASRSPPPPRAGIGPYMGLEMASFDLLPETLPSFARGFAAALIATVSCYPLDTIRRHIQLQVPAGAGRRVCTVLRVCATSAGAAACTLWLCSVQHTAAAADSAPAPAVLALSPSCQPILALRPAFRPPPAPPPAYLAPAGGPQRGLAHRRRHNPCRGRHRRHVPWLCAQRAQKPAQQGCVRACWGVVVGAP